MSALTAAAASVFDASMSFAVIVIRSGSSTGAANTDENGATPSKVAPRSPRPKRWIVIVTPPTFSTPKHPLELQSRRACGRSEPHDGVEERAKTRKTGSGAPSEPSCGLDNLECRDRIGGIHRRRSALTQRSHHPDVKPAIVSALRRHPTQVRFNAEQSILFGRINTPIRRP